VNLSNTSLRAREDLEAQNTALFDYWTAHFEQTGIGGIIDMRAAMIVRPNVDLYEAAADIYTRVVLSGDGFNTAEPSQP